MDANNWHSLDLGDGVAAFQPTKKIQDAWMQQALNAAKLNLTDYSNAVFSTTEAGASKVTVFFTPTAEIFARAFGAVACAKPSPTSIGLLCGDQRAWEIHFPGEVDERRRNRNA